MYASPNSTAINYSYKFITEPNDDLKCLVCLEIASDPWQHSDCGKLFCRKCIRKHGMKNFCPYCKMKRPQYFRDNRSKREIGELRVKCDNVERDCQWVGTVGTLEEHVGVCEFVLVPCSNSCKDDNGILMIIRRDLQQHLIKTCPNRDYSCEHCGLKGTHATIVHHYHTCEKMIITCTNEECDMKMERMEIKNHLSNYCEHIALSCKYRSIGCDVKLRRKDMRAHEQDDKEHLSVAINTVVELKDEMEINANFRDKMAKSEVETNLKVIRMEETITSLKEVDKYVLIFKVTEYQKKKDNNVVFVSPSFYTSPNGYHMAIGMHANGYRAGKRSHVSVYAPLVKGKYDEQLNWPFVGEVTIELLNQFEDKNHHTHVVHFSPEHIMIVGYARGNSRYIPHSKLSHDLDSNTQYLKDDTLYFRISVQVPDHKPWLQCTV